MKKMLLEFGGSFGYLLFGAIIQLYVMNFIPNINFILEMFLISFGYAFSFFLIYTLCNKVDAVYINPIFSFSDWIRNKISNKNFILICGAQIFGAIIAGGILKVCFNELLPSIILTYGDNSIFNSTINIVIFMEFLFSLIFCFCYQIMKDKIKSDMLNNVLLSVLFFALLFFTIPYTGGSVNPIRFLLTNLFVNFDYLRQGFFYLFSSLGGALIASIIYYIISYVKNNDLT